MAFNKTHDSLNYENPFCEFSVPFYVLSRVVFFFLVKSFEGYLLLSVSEACLSSPPKPF